VNVYLGLMRYALEHDARKSDRSGAGTDSVFGCCLHFYPWFGGFFPNAWQIAALQQ